LPAQRVVALAAVGVGRIPGATVRISLLPGTDYQATPPPLLDLSGNLDLDPSLEPVQLLEGQEYRYEIDPLVAGSGTLSTNRPELFVSDDNTGCSGRLRPGLHTGTVTFEVSRAGSSLGQASFEVRSTKLHYLQHYRWMLSSLAEFAAEIVMSRFAASAQSFEPGKPQDPKTLYQRFAFLQALLTSEAFSAAVQQVLSRPYEVWLLEEIAKRPNQGLRASGQAGVEIARAGPRTSWPNGRIASLPRIVREDRTNPTRDNAPNRFAKFALTRWRDISHQVLTALSDLPPTSVNNRGLKEARELTDRLEGLLSEELFREVGDLIHFPGSNQVLHKREGYRDLFRAYMQFEIAAAIVWTGGEDAFRAGQRNVAALYEYWVFLQLGQILSELCGNSFDFTSLMEVSRNGLQLGLKRGHEIVLRGSAERGGRRLELELWYNRLFPRSDSALGSWTEAMRPDYSVKITPEQGELEHSGPIWVHFDAKYRVDHLTELFGKEGELPEDDDSSDDAEDLVRAGTAKRTDLLKMHAYRDAIRRSAGAYVLYPGTDKRAMRAFHEILPGLGAFALTPMVSGDAGGAHELRGFLEDILLHTATQVSQHERGRFWEQRIYQSSLEERGRIKAVPFLREPPADTVVLIGYVKSAAHLEWIRATRLYNMRADGRPGSIDPEGLGADLVVLWGDQPGLQVGIWRRSSNPQLKTRDQLFELGYPAPSGHLYYCLEVTEIAAGNRLIGLDRAHILNVIAADKTGLPLKAPHVTTWQTLAL
jgi:uncharacterized protein